MTSSENMPNQNSSERVGLIQQVVAECIRRRSSGEALPDNEVISSHVELMPELGVELRKLRLVEQARHDAVRARSRKCSPPKPEAETTGWKPVPHSNVAAGPRTGRPTGWKPVPHSADLPEGFEGYEVVREIHHGGQGVVYQAIQKSTKRKVAIKVLHGGPFVDARSRARLEREIQILGQLDHPNIVGIHDSGTAAGCSYYVMDYISGEALDVYLLNNPLAVDDTLRLFVKICDAVNAAHLRGVIHRDLKPSNIRVDAHGEPHILDFGLAKVVLDAVTDEPHPQLMSMTGQFIGSLPWASPEQAAGQAEKIDLRTDVYALGVVLYQMLTGQFPYEVLGNTPDVLDNVIHAEPVRPKNLRREIDDEVATIVLKCLEKQRERRYQSAGELARDIRHYLAGEPIEAKRASTLYLLTKSLRRYRAALAVGAVFLVLLIVFGVTMTMMYRRAEHEAYKAELVADFLDDILGSVDPDVVGAERDSRLYKSLRRTLDNAAEKIEQLGHEPEVEARLRNSLGHQYMNLGLYQEAEEHLRRAVELRGQVFGRQDESTAEALFNLGWCLKEQGEYQAARQAYDEALQIRLARFGPDHLAVAESYKGLGQLLFDHTEFELAQPYLEDALELCRRLGAERGEIATAMANLGSLLRERGRLTEAEPLLREALEIRRELFGNEHHHTLVSMNKLGLLLREKGEHAAARELFEQYFTIGQKVLGDEHAHVGVAQYNLGLTLFETGDFAEAENYFRAAAERFRQTLGPKHHKFAEALIQIGRARWKQGDHPAAHDYCDQALSILSPDNARRARALLLRGQLLLAEDDPASAVSPLDRSYQISKEKYGEFHRRTVASENVLAECLIKLERFREAEELLLNRNAWQEKALSPDDPQRIDTLERIIALYEAWARPSEAARFHTLLPPEQ
ncbi:MAG: serine/threonine protein kinase [Phycisphaerae bacterium]|nr:serine/threonine protein kinase [Phycisphaerae bacterium]